MEKFLLQLDLNLLKALHVLLQERNVTRSAERMFITQSAMSKTLRRLREAFNDPLLVKVPNGLVPTPLANQLGDQLANVFGQLAYLAPSEFDPKKIDSTLCIAAPETFSLALVPAFITTIKKLAPNLKITLVHIPEDYLEPLANGEVDFVLYIDQPYPEDFITHRLNTVEPKIWCREDHPLAKKPVLSLDDVCAYPKIAFQSPNILPTELHNIFDALDHAELNRDVFMTTSHLLVALTVLRASDALMVAPDDLANYPVSGIVSHSFNHIPMFSGVQRIPIALVQHERTVSSPLHKWVVEQAVSRIGKRPRRAAGLVE